MNNQPHRILDKKIENGEEVYLVHMLGRPSRNALWITKQTVEKSTP
jgi:hypothetical protein